MTPAVLLIWLGCCIRNNHASSEMRQSGIYITVSSYSGFWSYGHFEINWFGIPEKYLGVTYAVLSRKNPPRAYSDVLSISPVLRPTDRFTTSVPAPSFNVSTLMRGECLGYWAVILGESHKPWEPVVLYSSCFTPKPRWMRQNCCKLSTLSLLDMLIPGTHNAGMYNQMYTHPHEEYLYNQDQTIAQQLAYGIRSLDLRVQYSGGEFYVTHSRTAGWPTIRQVLKEVREFVEVTGELVLLDFHRFTKGFDEGHDNVPARHLELVNLIVTVLRDVLLEGHAYVMKLDIILDECRNETKPRGHVIVFYNYEQYKGPYEHYLGPAVEHRWPNAQSQDALMRYLKDKACVRGSGSNLISIMAELTPSFPALVIGNRRAAQWVNHDVTEYFRREGPNCSGIIATDYFLGNGIIEVAIEANLEKGREGLFVYQYQPHKHCNVSDTA
ncbi:uncharacterized protein LOC119455223 isoform X2 [Dermacentor silvarum]|uniref:uncharacterized protein LOC119455223 isoform X2 n=1 Tax=Dermacentor silvarum TaxID=543639 RepID=UPI002100F91E|nr:uncharacterized protein LOC119455223 isoform X2 [Dermacentor silvarum]